MPSYQTLNLIADARDPILLMCVISCRNAGVDGGLSAAPGAQFASPTRTETAVPLQLEPTEAGITHTAFPQVSVSHGGMRTRNRRSTGYSVGEALNLLPHAY